MQIQIKVVTGSESDTAAFEADEEGSDIEACDSEANEEGSDTEGPAEAEIV